MNRSKRYIGTCVTQVSDDRRVLLNPGDLVTNLLLFDKYILHSIQLLEFPQIVSVFGYEQTLELLKLKSIQIKCDANVIMILGDTTQLIEEGRWLTFDFTRIRASNHKDYIHSCFEALRQKVRLPDAKFIKLKGAIAGKLDEDAGKPYEIDSPELKLMRDFYGDITTDRIDIRKAITNQIKALYGISILPSAFTISFYQIGNDLLKAETNLVEIASISKHQVHEAITWALLDSIEAYDCLGLMNRYESLCGLNGQTLPVLEEKLGFLARDLDPTQKVDQFKRVLEIKGFPAFDSIITEGNFKLDRLVEILDARECREFRDWLTTLDSSSDEEIREQVENFRARLGNFITQPAGKTVRFLVTTALGPLGNFIDVAASSIDTFVLEKVFPNSGPLAFINHHLPSIFRLNNDGNKLVTLDLNKAK